MRKNFILSLSGLLVILLATSCIKQIEKQFQGASVVEFDATVLNSATSPYTYHVAVRTPPFGIPITTANSTAISRTMTTPVKLRINLVGPLRNTDEVLTYRVMSATELTPATPNLIAVDGTHFTTGTTVTIPANSSFGEITINILNSGVSNTSPREVHLELIGNENIKPSENYKRIGIRISQS